MRTLQILGVDFRGNPPPPDRMQLLASSLLNERTLEKCRTVLQEVLEDWLLLKLRDNLTDRQTASHTQST
jgi:hypothetical protein